MNRRQGLKFRDQANTADHDDYHLLLLRCELQAELLFEGGEE